MFTFENGYFACKFFYKIFIFQQGVVDFPETWPLFGIFFGL